MGLLIISLLTRALCGGCGKVQGQVQLGITNHKGMTPLFVVSFFIAEALYLQSFQHQGESQKQFFYWDPWNTKLYRGSTCQAICKQCHRGFPTVLIQSFLISPLPKYSRPLAKSLCYLQSALLYLPTHFPLNWCSQF